jgi:hypothetical protein
MADTAVAAGSASVDDERLAQLQAQLTHLQLENQHLHEQLHVANQAQAAQQQQQQQTDAQYATAIATQESIHAQTRVALPKHSDLTPYSLDQDIDVWLLAVNVLLAGYLYLPAAQRVQFTIYGLRNCNGLTWWKTIGELDYQNLVNQGTNEWDAFEMVVRKHYRDPALNGRIYKALINIKQRNGESVTALFTRFFTMMGRLGHKFDDFMIKNTIRNALHSAILQRMTIDWNTATVDVVRHNASETERDLKRDGVKIFTPKPNYLPRDNFDRSSGAGGNNGNHKGASGSGATGDSGNGATPMELGVRTAAPNSVGPFPAGHCFNCGVQGHWEGDCRQPLRPERRAARQRYATEKAARAAAERARKGKGPAVN